MAQEENEMKKKAPKFPKMKTKNGDNILAFGVYDDSENFKAFENLTIKQRIEIIVWAMNTHFWLAEQNETNK